jgi:Concanavalin A-like lectin/glucanases superfamily/Domain of unknown function (DUF2341)
VVTPRLTAALHLAGLIAVVTLGSILAASAQGATSSSIRGAVSSPSAATATPTGTSSTTIPALGNAAASWYGSGWGYRQPITIDHTKVAATQTSFPVLISFASDASLAANALANGNDILFTAADGTTKLNHEIESYNSSTGELVAWVLVPNLSSTVDTQIYLYFGNPSASNQQNVPGTWASSNYGGVWHLPNGSSLSLADSTANANNGTNHGATATTGKIDGAASLNGSGQYVSTPATSMPAINGNLTISGWFYVPSYVGFATRDIATLYSSAGTADQLRITGSGYLQVSEWGGAIAVTGTHSITTNAWHYAAFTYDGSTASLYLDGTLDNSATPSVQSGSSSNVYIGSYSGGEFWNGALDEIRVSNTTRSAAWIQTEWNNESSPSSFFSIGSVEQPDTTPPNAFSITSPSAGATVANGQVLSSSPTDNVSVASVAYRYCAGSSCTWAAGTDIGTATSGPPFTVTWSSQPANGTYTLIARATDPSGNSTDSATTTVSVQNQVSIALVQSGSDTRSSGTSITPTLGVPSTAGTLLVAYVQWYSTTSSVSAPSGWVQATSAKTSSTGSVALWYYPNNPGGITSVTFTTTSSGGYFVGELSEWSGVSPTSPLDRTGSTTSTSTTSVTVSANGATTTANELAITGFTTYSAPTSFGPGSGWSNVFSAPSDWATSDYKLGIASGTTVSERQTDAGTSNTWAAVLATFRPASGACSGGSLGLTVPSSLTFPSLTLNGSDQTTTTTVALTPDDETGGGAGWNITGTSTTLTASSRTLPTTATSITTATAAAASGNCSLPTNGIAYPVTLPAGTSPPTPVKLYNAAAGTGSGPATVTLTARVAVPANAYSTTYTSTWTLAIVSGP